MAGIQLRLNFFFQSRSVFILRSLARCGNVVREREGRTTKMQRRKGGMGWFRKRRKLY
jgi:hypothetical protein